jgi:outer membrane receptor protein involved in Fe transport
MRARLLASSVIVGVSVTVLTAAPAAAQEAGGAELSEIVVTGSRLPRPNLEQPTPIAVLSATAIEGAGPQSLGDLIARLPQVNSSATLRANANNLGNDAGVSSIDLRGLGVSRTLVLVDGQRHVAGDVTSNAVDINAIPPALVDRVEVITGGASAIYGSDAVSGVVNIITKKKFEGLQAEVQAGGYDDGFGAKYSASVTAGRNFLDDRLNVAVSGFWRKESAVNVRDLPSAHNYGLISNPADVAGLDPSFHFSGPTIPNDGIPDRLYVQNVGSDLTTQNGVLVNAVTGAAVLFDAAGKPITTPTRTGYNSFAFGQLPDCANCYFPEQFTQASSPIKTKGAALNAHMDFSDHLHGFVDAKFVQNDVGNSIQPSISANMLLMPDNAFLTPAIGAALDPTTFYVISRFLNGGREQDIRRRTYRVVAGLDGEVDAKFAEVKWDGALNYGETDTRILDKGLRIIGNFAAALDSVIDPATGQAACRINVPSAPPSLSYEASAVALNPSSCVPYNPFGQQNGAAAMAYSFGDFGIHDLLTQQVANLNAQFDTSRFLQLPGGPIGVAAGAEYRMERTRERNDPMMTAGLTENAVADSAGGYNVYEGYLELNAPIFRDAGPLLDELSIDAAYRGAHYSTVGGVSSYKVGGVYGPVNWLKLRGSYSRAIRAPNITEAFLPLSATSFNRLKDPCSVENVGANVNFAANCAAAGLPAGFVAPGTIGIPGTISGNAQLDPETSHSYTVGFAVTPTMVPGLAMTLDYYSIKIRNAITEVQAQDILNNCYGSSTGLNSQYCSLFTRETAHNGLSSIHTTYVNAAKLFTEGFELQVSYAADVAPLTSAWRYTRPLDGRVSFHLTADYVMRLRNYPFQQNPGQVNILEGTANDTFGNNPQLKAVAELNYAQGPLTLGWTTRYIGRQALFDRDPTAADHSESRDIPFTEPVFYHDLSVAYRMDGRAEGTELFAGAQNLFDEQPPFTVSGTTRGAAFDLGRFLYVGARYRR